MGRDDGHAARHPRSGSYEGRTLANPDEPIFDQGLRFDLETLLDRRRALKLIGYTGLSAGLFLVGCRSSTGNSAGGVSPSASTLSGTGAAGECTTIPEETAGPYPGDGSNGPDVLGQNGIVRSDIRSSFGQFSGATDGVPLTIKLTIQDASNDCAPLRGAAVYVWHCDRDGRYSLYTVTDQNYLRGVQEAGNDGTVTFTSVYPACYSGRWPHIHFEVLSEPLIGHR